MLRLLGPFLIFFIPMSFIAQDTLLLLNGKQLIVDITDDTGASIFFDVEKKNGRVKHMDIHKLDIFSIKKDTLPESILYVQDPDFGYELSVEDMRFYMAGQNDARNGYDHWPSTIGGAVFGAATVFYLEGGYAPFVSPFAYAPVMQIPFIKISEKSISDPAYTISDRYVEGYNKTARSKKLFNNFLGTLAGVALGSVVYELSQ